MSSQVSLEAEGPLSPVGPGRHTYTAAEVALMLKFTLVTVYHHLQAGVIPGGKKVGRRTWRVDGPTFDRWIRTESR